MFRVSFLIKGKALSRSDLGAESVPPSSLPARRVRRCATCLSRTESGAGRCYCRHRTPLPPSFPPHAASSLAAELDVERWRPRRLAREGSLAAECFARVEGGEAGDGLAQDERVHVVRPLVGVDGLEVGRVPHDVVLVLDAYSKTRARAAKQEVRFSHEPAPRPPGCRSHRACRGTRAQSRAPCRTSFA